MYIYRDVYVHWLRPLNPPLVAICEDHKRMKCVRACTKFCLIKYIV